MDGATPRWLILAHQLPAQPSNLRVRVWRRLQQVGAVVLRNALYVLPATDEAREDFAWVREEIAASGGQVSVLEAAAIDGMTDAELVRQFKAQSTGHYEALTDDIRTAAAEISGQPAGQGPRQPAGRRGTVATARERLLHGLRERYVAIQARDYFEAAGRPLVEQAFRALEAAGSSAPTGAAPAYQRRTWVTRPRPGIDRIACAWLIRRFIDPHARFAFVTTPDEAGPKRLPFDMPDVEFGHQGAHCSIETLMARFGIDDPAVVPLSRVVHDLDLKESTYGMPECVAVGRLVDGLRRSHPDDSALLEQGIAFMEALYQSFASETSRPRARRRRR